MSEFGQQINYKQLLLRHGFIRIPMIQRDFAQGRPSEIEVREEFLSALGHALRLPVGDPSLPLNLDFIYGSVEGEEETRFSPLDGQQRLTTLFLLHWYLAWCDERWEEFAEMFRANERSRFSYNVRPSSNEFFDALVSYQPKCRPDGVSDLSRLITDQPWYFRSWRLDPTIQSTLFMLDAIHVRFRTDMGLFERLTSETQPAITFQLLDLNNFGLSDDLYIKMNARGKPLTAFETFKARFEQELGKQFSGETRSIENQDFPIADFVARRMDTAWSDLFWAYRDRESNLYDGAFMNIFRAVALVTRDPENKSYLEDVQALRSLWSPPSYSDFSSRGWLDRSFTTTLICLLETWSGDGGTISRQLPDARYFDEQALMRKLVAGPADLSYTDVVQFAAYVGFIREHCGALDSQAFQEWMRVVANLSQNTDYNRPDDLRRSITGLISLEKQSANVLGYFAGAVSPAAGFSEQQIAEEKLKAELILAHKDWRSLIDRAEGHPYFRSQIEFLLDFCGALAERSETVILLDSCYSDLWEGSKPVDWSDEEHVSLQERFNFFLARAELMFGAWGLKSDGECRW